MYIFLTFLFFACKRNQNPNQNILSCEIDGVQWETSQVGANVIQSGALFTVDIQATHSNGQVLYLKIYSLSQSGVGNYPFGNASFQNEAIYAPQGNLNQTAQLWKSSPVCASPQGNYIQIDELQNGFLNGSFVTAVCQSNGSIKRITNGRLINLVIR